jgi:hypothetical protein
MSIWFQALLPFVQKKIFVYMVYIVTHGIVQNVGKKSRQSPKDGSWIYNIYTWYGGAIYMHDM